jgi:hypothetical protein
MPNQRISELNEKLKLNSNCLGYIKFRDATDAVSTDNNKLLLIAKERSYNKKTSFANLKKSILDSSLQNNLDQNINGKKIFVNKCSFREVADKQVENLYKGSYINQSNTNSDPYAKFQEKQILLSASNKVNFSKSVSFSEKNGLSIGKLQNLGSLNTSGKTYIPNIYIKENGVYKKVENQENQDNNIYFNQKLQAEKNIHKIYLPKTFKYKPVISVNLLNNNQENFIAYTIFNVTELSFYIKFDQALNSNNYSVDISAFSPSTLDNSNTNPLNDSKKIQRFHTLLNQDNTTHTINFPFSYNSTPVIHVSIENEEIPPVYSVSNITNNSFEIKFQNSTGTDFIIHTLSQEIN